MNAVFLLSLATLVVTNLNLNVDSVLQEWYLCAACVRTKTRACAANNILHCKCSDPAK